MMVWVLYYNTPFLTAKVILMWLWGFVKSIKVMYFDYIYNFINYITEGISKGFHNAPKHSGAKELTDKFNHINKIAADATYVEEFHSVLRDLKTLEPQWRTGKGQPRWYDVFRDDYKSSSWLRSAPSHVSNGLDYWEIVKNVTWITCLTLAGAGLIILILKYWVTIKGLLFLGGSGIKSGIVYCASGIKAGVLAVISYFSGGGSDGSGGSGGASGLTDNDFVARLNDDSLKTPISTPGSSIWVRAHEENATTPAQDGGPSNPWGVQSPGVRITKPTPPQGSDLTGNALGLKVDIEKSPILSSARYFTFPGMSNWDGTVAPSTPSVRVAQSPVTPSVSDSSSSSQHSSLNNPSTGLPYTAGASTNVESKESTTIKDSTVPSNVGASNTGGVRGMTQLFNNNNRKK